MAYAKGTEVQPERSRAEIERTLKNYGADAFSYGYEDDRAIVAFRAQGRYIRFEVRTPPLTEFRMTRGRQYRSPGQQKSAQDAELRRRWRALLLVIKAKLESVESGIENFEEAFLAHIVLPDKTTVAEFLQPQIEQAYETGEMPPLLPAVKPQLEAGAQEPDG